MGYTNSPLVTFTKLSPNHSGQRTHSIDRITPHCVVGQCSVEVVAEVFAPKSRKASCNYVIGNDGRVGLICEEKNRSWCSSSAANDQRAVTIECASDKEEPYAFNDKVYARLIELCTDICRRNGKAKLLWLEDKKVTLAYEPAEDEMILTVHRWFANKSCPGDWMMERMGDLAEKVTAALGGADDSPAPAEVSTPAPAPGEVEKDTSTEEKIYYNITVGAYPTRDEAEAVLSDVRRVISDAFIKTTVGKTRSYNVVVGVFGVKANADRALEDIRKKYPDAFIKRTVKPS